MPIKVVWKKRELLSCNSNLSSPNQLKLKKGGAKIPTVATGPLLSAIPLLGELPNWILLPYTIEAVGFERLSKLGNLEVLDLSHNSFDNSILASLGSLSSLKSLYLSSNKLEGSINIGELPSFTLLEGLDLRGNELDKSIFSYIKGLSSLKFLDLANGQLKGSIDVTELNALGNLETLYLGDNEISGFVTSTGEAGLLQLSKLEELDLTSTQFNNSIWSSLRALPSLKHLDLEENHLKGPVDMQGVILMHIVTQVFQLLLI
ncbi:hypothetical protein Tsubulata_014085 [Turnera subulata]|uniref:Leucine-rich repeat-containing N-terminal plant-type domain-containing protein n=1 Tax=Turnera subulata TaxID=218843 RepID=A0A9Q0GBN1_9ROSI|nr:hypothetical protein Tsubulata_014085 [Turnera subulata]